MLCAGSLHLILAMMDNSATFKFDGSIEGLLSAVFDSYYLKIYPQVLTREVAGSSLFDDDIYTVITDPMKAGRVWRALERRVSKRVLEVMVTSFLVETTDGNVALFRYIRSILDSRENVESDFSNHDAVDVLGNCRRVRGEAHRLLQFARFQKAADGTYFALMEPRYDVLPMCVEHFVDRFSDSSFVIYDRKRNYGFHYDGSDVRKMKFMHDNEHVLGGGLSDSCMDSDERFYQQLWRTYFQAIAIKERINPRKQRQDMPCRFWPFLTEMQ